MRRFIAIVALLVGFKIGAAEPGLAIIPAPQTVEMQPGQFVLTPQTRIRVDVGAQQEGRALAERLRRATGWIIPVGHGPGSNGMAGEILVTTQGAPADLGAEGYDLVVHQDGAVIRASTAAGSFYGAQSFLQLLPPEVFSAKALTNMAWEAPCVHIQDKPRFGWRGWMLDVSRHFYTKQEVKRWLDLLAMHKINVFHWHLVDDPGWRIEIKKYPKLTEVGAWRDGVGFGFDKTATTRYGADGKYGGFYTQDDIREVVGYAQARHITIVPEIEMPGHSGAALRAYPELRCVGAPESNVYCAGNDQSFAFLENVLTEVMALFPGKYIHIGGDEVDKGAWAHCEKCQARIKAESLKDEKELQSYFIRRIEKFINSKGRTLLGWSEIREGGLAQNAALMDWIGGAVEGASEGHDVVMSPTDFCYLDHFQSTNRVAEPPAIGDFLPLSQVYSFEPVPAKLPEQFRSHILGAQGNVWTEFIPNAMQVDYMTFPREAALAEVTWSPKEARNWDDFSRRLRVDDKRLSQLNVNYCHDDTDGYAARPEPHPPTLTLRQAQWENLGVCGFLHFSMNTFTDKEWGGGDESETNFNPTDFDADEIARVAADSGLRGLVLTCKHHDGFCLWPSRYTEHSVKNSPWKGGKGDVVKEISEACQRHGLTFGIYLSPWDRNRAEYGRPEYITYFRNQLRELLTQYGAISEVWFDGANGGDGYYGGAKEKRTIDRRTYYDWPETWKLVRELQPDACIFSDGGPDIRWVGNEDGHAGSTCWETLNRADFAPGQADSERLNRGDRPGTDWVPAECDVSIRPGWFYHASEDAKVKTPAQLVDLYFASVGRGASLLLNIPPDRRGQIAEADQRSLAGFHHALETTFARNLALGAKAEASNVRGNDSGFGAPRVLDGWDETYWATDDGVTNAQLVITLPKPTTFNIVSLREYLPLGQRVDAFALDQWANGRWVEFATGTSIGKCRLVRGAPITTDKVRLRILNCATCPAIAEVGLFAEGS